MTDLNTSYARKYVVVSKGPQYVVLRVTDESLYNSYWREFLGADIAPEYNPDDSPMYIKVEQVPPEVVLVDQYATFIPELPLVRLEVDGKSTNVTSKVSVNAPNTETPGLFRLDYRLDLNKKISSVFWSSYVSVQQRPLLRKAAAGWARDGYAIKTLNRLVLEPQFLEALQAAGEPLYGFMQANQHPAIRAAALPEYADIRVWGPKSAGDDCIFVSGKQLPQGSIIVYNQRALHLQTNVLPDVAKSPTHMDPETHLRTETSYAAGTVVRRGKVSYMCVADAPSDASFNDTAYWMQGFLYRYSLPSGAPIELPIGSLPHRTGAVEHIWVTVDNLGYPFWVDISNTTSLGLYRGHYDKKFFADYGPGDIVSYIDENAIRLFRRKASDIQDESSLIYPPGHYRNPAWEEVYFQSADDENPLLSSYSIIPHTNATNAILAKTGCVSEDICNAYAHLVGIPKSIMDACGPKWSALLFALLSRTRNTFDGLRICMQAVGLDVKNLRLSDPSYTCLVKDTPISDIYEQHKKLKELLSNIASLEPGHKYKDEENALRYDPDNPGAIQQYSNGSWNTVYQIEQIDPTHIHNNRYFDCDAEVLARLAADAIKNLGDGNQWIKAPAWAGEYSALLSDIINYEIPIYVYVRMHIFLYDESKIELESSVFSGILDGQAAGHKNVLELFPSYCFSEAEHDFVEVPIGVFTKTDDDWAEIPYTKYDAKKNTYLYEFSKVPYPLRIRSVQSRYVFQHYWVSPHTTGLLGLPASTSTDRFIRASDPEVSDADSLMLVNGYVGVTPIYRAKASLPGNARAKCWQYLLNTEAAPGYWSLDEVTPFADWGDATVTSIIPFEGGVSDLKAKLTTITANTKDGDVLPFDWDGDTLMVKKTIPKSIYLHDAAGKVLACFGITPGKYTLSEQDCLSVSDDIELLRIPLVYG